MMKFYTGKNIYQATKLVSNYKKQGFSFVRNFGKGQNLYFYGTLRTSKGNLRQVYIFTNIPHAKCRIVSYRLIKDYKTMKRINGFINGHAWGY